MDVSGEIHASTALHLSHEHQYRLKIVWVVTRAGLEALEKKKTLRPIENRKVIPRLLNKLRASALDGSEELASSYSCFYSGQTAYSARRQNTQQSSDDSRSGQSTYTKYIEFATFIAFCKQGFKVLLYYYYITDISFMQCVYTYISETNHIPREHCVAAILMLLFMVRRSLIPALIPSLR
jgi:hypothetical protein